ncbi:MAG: hypothetical protein Q7U97_12045 [Rhodocyclaceae bacterium]|nr:hypothetical protein [Rhodocyclaceae bacterium]
MNRLGVLVIVGALSGLGGCATPPTKTTGTDSGTSASVARNSGQVAAERDRRVASGVVSAPKQPTAPRLALPWNDSASIPDAVIKIDPGTGKLTPEMEGRLIGIVDEAKQNDHTIIRLECYVPEGGSPSMNLGVADRTLQIVKDRLQELGVSSRRILLASFGSEYDEERDPHRHWVEIYLLKSGYPTAQ